LVKQLLYLQLICLIHEFNTVKFYHTANVHIPSETDYKQFRMTIITNKVPCYTND